jgi:outer membrane protein assembly factor BamB
MTSNVERGDGVRATRAATVLVAASLVLFAGSIDPPMAQSALDYPQWRGINRNGEASGFIVPAQWPATLRRRWKVQVGPGYATPIVIDQRVFVFTREADEEMLVCLDATTGRSLWKTAYPAPYVPSKPTAVHGAGPKATPAFHNGRIFTLGISGIVAAFDAASGKLLWRSPAPAEAPYFSAASSPLADGDLVFAHPGNYGPLTAFDAATGAVRWTAGDGGFFASPLLATISGTRQLITITQKNVIGVAIDGGAVLWEFPWAGAAGGPMPVLYGGSVIVSGLDQGVAAFTPSKRDGSWVVERRWETKDVSMYLSNPVIVGNTLFGLSHRAGGQYFALDAGTGATLWRGEPRQATNTALVKAGDLLFLLNDDGELIIAAVSDKAFLPIRRYTVADSATWAQPALSGNRAFVRDVSTLTLWTFD